MATKNSSLVLKILILLAKLKKPLLRKLLSLKKLKKKLKLLEHYSYYTYAKEYEFSPSTTPIIEFRRISKYGRLSLRKLYSNLVLICRSVMGSNKEIYQLEMGLSSSLVCAGEMAMIGTELSSTEDDDQNDNDNDESVDERAEIFIQRFYQEMRRQRIESNSQLLLLN